MMMHLFFYQKFKLLKPGFRRNHELEEFRTCPGKGRRSEKESDCA